MEPREQFYRHFDPTYQDNDFDPVEDERLRDDVTDMKIKEREEKDIDGAE